MAGTKKAGDSLIPKKGEVIVAKGKSGAVAVIHKGEQTANQWGEHTAQAIEAGHAVYVDGKPVTVRDENSPVDSAVDNVKSAVGLGSSTPGSPKVAPNGATERQVHEGGTPDTFHETPVMDAVSNAGKALATTIPGLQIGETVQGLKDSAKAVGTNPAVVGAEKMLGIDAPTDKKLPDAPGGAAELPVPPIAGASDTGTGGPPKDTQLVDPAAREAAVRANAQGLIAEAQAKLDAHEKLSTLYTEMKVTDLEHQKNLAQAQQIEQDARMVAQKHLDGIQAEQARLDPTIDPSRYWQNKSGGQVALGALAAACFGFAGKGMDYLKMIQGEVDRDVDAQKATYENKRGNLKDQRAGYESEYEKAIKNGLSDRQALESARIASMSALNNSAEAMKQQGLSAEQSAKIVGVQQGMQLAIQNSQIEVAKDSAKVGQERSATYLNYAMAAQARAKAKAAANTKPKGDKTIQQIDNAAYNIQDNLTKAKALIEKSGTVNLTGPEDAELKRYLHNYSIYAAKLKDPNSAVKPSEAEGELKALGLDTGLGSMGTRNSVYAKRIDDTLAQLRVQRDNAYKAHSMTADDALTPDDGTGFSGGE